MNLDLNFATRPFVNRMPHVLLLVSVGAAAAGFTTWNTILFLSTRSEARAALAQLGAIAEEERQLNRRGEEIRAALARADLADLELQVAAADGVLAQKALSWSLLLERLEELLPWSAALASIRTSVGAKVVSVSVDMRARSQEHYLEFVDALEGSPCFRDVYPDGEEKLETGEFVTRLEFRHDPTCGTVPPAPVEPRSRGSRTGRSGGRPRRG